LNIEKLHAIIQKTVNDRGQEKQLAISSASKLRRDLGFDSLELAVLAVRIEAEFGVDVFADGVVETVGEIERKILSGSREE
jgi:acyl carrier protein